MSNNAKNQRFPGVDLAKVVAIFFVMVHHVSDCGLDWQCTNLNLAYVHTLIHSVSYSCIDLFALATGFLCVNSKCRYSRLATLWVAAFFWGLTMLAFSKLCLGLDITWKYYLNAALPVLRQQYWFFTAYFMLFLVMPFLNSGIKSITKRELHHLLVAIAIFLCGYSCLGCGDQFQMHSGYSFGWLCVVYVIGAYIRIYSPLKMSPPKCFCVAGVIAFVCCFRQLLSIVISYRIPGDRFCLSAYTSPFTLAIALFIFIGCLNLSFSERIARFLKTAAATTFGIYLIHVQPFVWKNIWHFHLHQIQVGSISKLIVLVTSLSLLTFIAFAIVEHIRLKVFDRLGINRLIGKIDLLFPR